MMEAKGVVINDFANIGKGTDRKVVSNDKIMYQIMLKQKNWRWNAK